MSIKNASCLNVCRELVHRLQTTAVTSAVPAADTHILSILNYIASLHPDLPLELPSLLPELHPSTASQVVRLLAGIAGLVPGVADRVILALRKGSFARELQCQAATISSLLTVLQLQLDSTAAVPLTSYLSQSSQVDTVDSFGIAFDEIIALCKRFLHSQYPIRCMVYRGFCTLAGEVVFRRIALRVLTQHASGYVHETIAMEKIVSTNGTVLEVKTFVAILLLYVVTR